MQKLNAIISEMPFFVKLGRTENILRLTDDYDLIQKERKSLISNQDVNASL